MLNAHDIAYELEKIVEKTLGYDFDHSGTFFDRDIIHSRTFYSVMHFMLHIKGNNDSLEFLNSIYYLCENKNMDKIENLDSIFEKFKELIGLPKKWFIP